MDVDFLKTFITVAKLLNISRAGEEVYLTQPAVSKQIKSLEEHYGVKLFERINKRLLLTEGGRRLLNYACRIVSLYSESLESVNEKDNDLKGILRIVSNLTLGIYILPNLIKPFSDTYSDLKIEIFLDNTDHIINAVRCGNANFGFVGQHPNDPSIIAHPFFRDKLKVVVGPNLLIDKKTISWKELESLPFIQRERGSDIRETWEQWLKGREIKLRPRMELNNTEAIKSLIQHDMGFSILPWSTIKHDVRMGLLRVVSVPYFDFVQNHYICHHKGKMFSRPEKFFFEYIFSAVESGNAFLTPTF